MNKSTVLVFCCITLFSGCSLKKNEPAVTQYSASSINQLVSDAAAGDTTANVKLGNLFDLTIPFPTAYNNLILDSLTISGKNRYLVLLEHSNPVYNRLAIYDNQLNLYLVDKSLNGNLEVSVRPGFYTVKESFISKDTLQAERLSLYKISDSSAVLAFRTYTRLVMPKKEYSQSIDEISPETIRTSIIENEGSSNNNRVDTFIVDKSSGVFRSKEDLFNRFVLEEISNFNIKTRKPQITDQRSALKSVGVITNADSADTINSDANPHDYFMNLDETWKELRNISISNHLKQTLKGTRYLNNNIGASISVIPIEKTDSAEMLIDSKLNNVAEGKYKVRFSGKVEAGKNLIRFLEYSCGSKKYLVIFEASKYTYDKYQSYYDDIFNNFLMEC